MIESVDTIYRPLFTITFLHSGYQTPQENFLPKGMTVVPDEATKKLFINYQMDYRFYNNTLTCFIQCVLVAPPAPEPKSPFVPIDGDIQIRFLLRNSSDFFDKTWITPAGSKQLYRFSNKINNTAAGVLFLSVGPEVSDADLTTAAAVGTDENCFGVIDMYNSGTTNSSYDLLDAANALFKPAPAFTIKFQSRI
jgi:hypothetical protein